MQSGGERKADSPTGNLRADRKGVPQDHKETKIVVREPQQDHHHSQGVRKVPAHPQENPYLQPREATYDRLMHLDIRGSVVMIISLMISIIVLLFDHPIEL